jgi:hypothetical protein
MTGWPQLRDWMSVLTLSFQNSGDGHSGHELALSSLCGVQDNMGRRCH